MNLKKLKKLTKGKAKVVVVEDGEPTMVLISFDEYERIKQEDSKEEAESSSKEETVEEAEEEYLSGPNPDEPQEQAKGELKVEDLPF